MTHNNMVQCVICDAVTHVDDTWLLDCGRVCLDCEARLILCPGCDALVDRDAARTGISQRDGYPVYSHHCGMRWMQVDEPPLAERLDAMCRAAYGLPPR